MLWSLGAELRARSATGFVIYPSFLNLEEYDEVAFHPPREQTFIEALRSGARANLADTMAMRHPETLPDSSRYYYALASIPAVSNDSGVVNLLASKAKSGGAMEVSIARYTLLRSPDGSWRVTRRDIVRAM